MSWETTEKECADYIKQITERIREIKIREEGASDSTAPDLVVTKNGNVLFNVEIKESNSQAGQFVIFDSDNGYVFSKGNKCKEEVCKPIIDFINNNKSTFKSIGTAGTVVNCDKKLMYDRVVKLYKDEKNTKYFITKDSTSFIIFKTEELEKYFDISCVARRKKSGSKNVGEFVRECVEKNVTNYLLGKGINKSAFSFGYDGHHFQVRFNDGIDHKLGGLKFEGDCFNLNFSKLKDGEPSDKFTITILSNTNNPNVIFTLSLKASHPTSNEHEFLNDLN